MVRLTKIYTKTGDKGKTHLGDMSRVSKTDPLIEAYATVDEANSHIGIAMTKVGPNTKHVLGRIQNELFDVGADLATPFTKQDKLRVTEEMVKSLETDIDLYNLTLQPLSSFVMPGGSEASALLHIARTVVRRAERRTWEANETREINLLAAQYLNRLSDLLFVMARFYNEVDVLWQPGGQHPPQRFRDIGNAE